MGSLIDLTGQRFGKLVVINYVGKIEGKSGTYWNCQCDCGNTKIINGAQLRGGNTKTCGCGKYQGLKEYNEQQTELAKIPLGTRFGKLIVIEDIGMRQQVEGHNRRWYRCQCDCGNIHEVMGNTLKTGGIISCGRCLSSKGEYIISQLLNQHNIKYEHDKCLPQFKLEYNKVYRYDFIIYDDDNNIKRIIEFDGRQHTKGPDTDYWSHSKDTLETIQQRDRIKNEFCFKHKIPIIRIPYTYIDKITIDILLNDKFLLRSDE